MKKYLIFTTLFILIESASCFAVPGFITPKTIQQQPDSLHEYTGKYQMLQGQQVIYADVYVENGKLTAKSSSGGVLTLEHLSGDNFIISKQGTAIKFIRDGANNVSQIAVMGNVVWTRVNTTRVETTSPHPAVSADYLGKYQITVNGQTMLIEVTIKDGQLWCTQLWDGANSALDYVSGDDFTIRALSMPLQFIRDKDNKVVQLKLNRADLFVKIKN